MVDNQVSVQRTDGNLGHQVVPRLQAGIETIAVKLSGYADWEREVKTLGAEVNLNARLSKYRLRLLSRWPVEISLLHARFLFRGAVAAQQLGQVLRECRARQDHVATNLVGLLF